MSLSSAIPTERMMNPSKLTYNQIFALGNGMETFLPHRIVMLHFLHLHVTCQSPTHL